jgi:hypothetical protein
VTAALRANADSFTWAAAVIGSNRAAGYQLAARVPVMAIGGFNGTDPAPSLAQFQADVAAHRIHWFIAARGFGGDDGVASQIGNWVARHYRSVTIGGTAMYDLSGGTGPTA